MSASLQYLKKIDAGSVMRRLDLWEGVTKISEWFEDENFRRFVEGKAAPYREKLTWKFIVTDFDWMFSIPPESTP